MYLVFKLNNLLTLWFSVHVDKGYIFNADFGDHCSLVLTNNENCIILMFFRFARITARTSKKFAVAGGLKENF